MAHKPNFTLHEIFTVANDVKNKKEKITFLRDMAVRYRSIKTILAYAYDSNIVFLLPEKIEYKPCEFIETKYKLHKDVNTLLWYFIDPDKLSQTRRNQMFLDILETVDPHDALLLLAVKDKKIPYKTLTKKLIMETFPDIING
jgi:hypothetical protein